MCGLAGFVGSGDAATLNRMTQALVHRGPDEEGCHTDADAPVFLGHRRLAIVDLADGKQPMWNEDRQVVVVYNGEIYNHEALRRELTDAGHVFSTDHSDTEVLVHGWEEWGTSLPSRLNGMFAFAIYDRRRKVLFLARDRFGEKPLYYSDAPRTFAFASELNALLLHPEIDREVDEIGVKKYFAYGYIPSPNTHIRGCKKLQAGHHLTFDLVTRKRDLRPFWTFALEPDESLGDRQEPRLVEELRHHLSEAVRRRLVSDVPLGMFLSGGIDSSAVVSLAAQHLDPSQIRTFAIGFDEPSYDESAFARDIAHRLGTEHREQVLDLASAKSVVPEILERLDDPIADPSIVPTYLLSRFTRQYVTVALSGDGGDELFAGYDPFDAIRPAQIYNAVVPDSLHRNTKFLADRLPRSRRNMSLDFKIRRALVGLSYHPKVQMPAWMAPLEPSDIAELLREPVSVEDLYSEAITIWQESRTGSPVDRMLEFFTRIYLQDDILPKVDRASMMVSLEVRAVFLDNDLVDFCRRLPNRFKYRNGTRKYLLKKALSGTLPDTTINRKKKGFGMPVSEWLMSIPKVPPMHGFGRTNIDLARQYWNQHRAGSHDHRLFLWSWLAMQNAFKNTGLASSA